MEIFHEILYKYLKSEARNVSKTKHIILKDSTMTKKEVCEKAVSTLAKVQDQSSSTFMRKLYEYVVCKKWFCFAISILLAVETADRMVNNHWYYCIYSLLLLILFSYLTITNPPNDGLFIWRLKLHLWFWGIPQPTKDMAYPKCIFVQHDTFEFATLQKWLKKEVFEKLKKYLWIYDLKEIENTIKIAQNTDRISDVVYRTLLVKACAWLRFITVYLSYVFIIYHFNREVALGMFLAAVVLYFLPHSGYELIRQVRDMLGSKFLIAFNVGVFSTSISALYNINVYIMAVFSCLFACASAIGLFLGKHDRENNDVNDLDGNDFEENLHVLDVICRLHKVIKHESIFFAVVTNDLNFLAQIPEQYQRYFKFVIKPANKSEALETYDQIFDLSEISNFTPSRSKFPHTNITYWVEASLQCIRKDAPSFVVDGLKFLSLLIKTSDKVLPGEVILSVVRPQLNRFASIYRQIILFKEPEYSRVNEFLAYLRNSRIIHDDQEDPQLPDEHPHNYDWQQSFAFTSRDLLY